MAAVPSDNAHAATPHHLRNKGPHASAQSPAHHISWTHHRIHAPSPRGWLLASNGRAGQAGDKGTCRLHAYLIGLATRSCPRWASAAGGLCPPASRIVALPRGWWSPAWTRSGTSSHMRELVPATGPATTHQSDRGILSVIAFGSVKRRWARQNQANCWLGRACDGRLVSTKES